MLIVLKTLRNNPGRESIVSSLFRKKIRNGVESLSCLWHPHTFLMQISKMFVCGWRIDPDSVIREVSWESWVDCSLCFCLGCQAETRVSFVMFSFLSRKDKLSEEKACLFCMKRRRPRSPLFFTRSFTTDFSYTCSCFRTQASRSLRESRGQKSFSPFCWRSNFSFPFPFSQFSCRTAKVAVKEEDIL